MFQVRIHGRGGQGVVTAAEMLSIAAFDEGFSNRQVWNDVALCAAGSLLGRPGWRARTIWP